MILMIALVGLQNILAESVENDAAEKYGPKAEEFCNEFYDKDENTEVKYLGKRLLLKSKRSFSGIDPVEVVCL